MRILIATATAGGGHLAAAAALEEAWRSRFPQDEIELVDIVNFFSPLHRRVHAGGYAKLVEHAPELWGMVFEKTDDPGLARRLNRLKQALPDSSRTKFLRHVRKFDPQVVVCTHYLPVNLLDGMKADSCSGSAAPLFLVSVITDFEAHALWMGANVDLYCVAAEETRARLLARGASGSQVAATGIPIGMRFGTVSDAGMIRKRMGLRDDLPVLLVLSGGFGMGPVAGILKALDSVQRSFQTVVVTGRNPELRRELAAVDRVHPTHILGFASNMHELMTVAELVITKPGGLTTSEALALGKPLFIVSPIPGQEAANSDFLLERGAAVKVNRVEDIPYRVEQLLGSAKLKQMSAAALALGRPDAALRICEEVVDRIRASAAPG